jgi:hypothetical protein
MALLPMANNHGNSHPDPSTKELCLGFFRCQLGSMELMKEHVLFFLNMLFHPVFTELLGTASCDLAFVNE